MSAPTGRGRRPAGVLAVLATAAGLIGLGVLLLRGCAEAEPTTIRAVAAGGMVCDPNDPDFNDGRGTEDGCQHRAVSEVAVGLRPDALLGLGDYQFEIPDADSYATHYASSWGRLRDVTIPALGNQEYKVHDANTFRDFFGPRVRSPEGYWAEDLGSWRVIVLNSNCSTVTGGCAEGSPQWTWLAQELTENPAQCTVALWHHPRWSNGIAGADGRTADLVELMADGGVDIGLSAHEADYERFVPLDGRGDPVAVGLRSFVVGTGGQAVYQPGAGDASWRSRQTSAGSEHFDAHHHGVLELELAPGSYQWRFHAVGGGADGATAVTDSGGDTCA